MGAATSHNMQLRFIVLVLLVLSTQAETSRRRPFSEAGRRLLWGYTDTRRRSVPTPAPTSATIYCDGASGDWVVKSYSNLNAVPGDNLIFKYGTSHDVYEMALRQRTTTATSREPLRRAARRQVVETASQSVFRALGTSTTHVHKGHIALPGKSSRLQYLTPRPIAPHAVTLA